MGVDLASVVAERPITLEQLSGRVLAVDAYNVLYQFLASIRQPDGTPLKDAKGRVTSHLSGLLYRTSNLVEHGVKLAFVFDGRPPDLKWAEIKRRQRVKEAASANYEKALREGRMEDARTYAQATSRLGGAMTDEAKMLLDALGVPWIQAPSEGEAQAAFMVTRGDAWAAASQDHDLLLFGAPRMIKNLTVTGRRKLPRQNAYVEISPAMVDLELTLGVLALTRTQLIDMGILIGTDFNEGVRGVGPKTAIKLIRQYGHIEEMLVARPDIKISPPPADIRDLFLNPEVTADYALKWRHPDQGEVIRIMCGEHGFSEDRVRKAVAKFGKAEPKEANKLDSYFG